MSTNEVRFNNIVRKEFGWTPNRIPTEAWFDAMDSSTLTTGTLQSKFGVLDLTANGGINPHTGVSWKAGDKYRLAFVSSTVRDATSTNIDDYNTHVQSAAIAAGLGGATWKAFVSTATVSAKENTGLTGSDIDTSTFNFASEIVGTNINDMFDYDGQSSSTGVTNKIKYDENGNGPGLADLPLTVPFYQFTTVWTGTNQNGDSDNVAGSGSVDFGICEAEEGYQWRRSTSASVTEQMYIVAISEVLMVGSSVSQWDDKSGNDKHAVQVTEGNRPTYNSSDYRFYDFPTVGYDQAKKFLGIPSVTIQNVYATTYYDDPDDTFDSFRLLFGNGATNTQVVQGRSGLTSFEGKGIFATESNFYRNGTLLPTDGESVLPMPPTVWGFMGSGQTTDIFRIMGGLQAYHYWEYGAIGEIIFTDGTENTIERQKIEGYLAWKWSGAL